MLNLKLLVQGLNGIIPGDISFLDYSIVAETDQISAKEILNTLVANKIGTLHNNTVNFKQADKLKASLFALHGGGTHRGSRHIFELEGF